MDLSLVSEADKGCTRTRDIATRLNDLPVFADWGVKYPVKEDTSYSPSGLYGMCYRFEVLKQRVGVRYNNNTVAQSGVMIPGIALHDYWQNQLLPRLFPFYGNWKCEQCGRICTMCARPEVCVCGSRYPFQYSEFVLICRSWEIKGRIDGIVKVGDEYQLIELKSVDPELFKQAKDGVVANYVPPMASNLFQSRVYLWMTGLKKCRLIYINKANNDIIEFIVKADPDIQRKATDGIAFVRNAIATKMPLSGVHGVCKKRDETRATRCPYCEECFSGEDFVKDTVSIPRRLETTSKYVVIDLSKNITLLDYLHRKDHANG